MDKKLSLDGFKIKLLALILMGLVRYLFQFIPALQRGDGFYPMNGIFQTFSILIIIFKGIDLIREKKLRGWALILLAIILPYVVLLGIQLSPMAMNFKNILFVIFSSLLPMAFMVEGGIFILISGVILYVFRENRKKQALFFFLFHFAWMTIIPAIYLRPISLKLMFTDYYEWMGALASLIMLSYNGERGRSMKGLFYTFYPVHIYLFYLVSIGLYKVL